MVSFLVVIFFLVLSITTIPSLTRTSNYDTSLYNNIPDNHQFLSLKNAYGFTYTPNNNNINLSLDKYEQIKTIQDSGPYVKIVKKGSLSYRNE